MNEIECGSASQASDDAGRAIESAELTPAQLAEAKEYGRLALHCDLADKLLDVCFLAVMAFLGAVPLDAWLARFVYSDTLRLVCFFLLITAGHAILSFPLSLYAGHVLVISGVVLGAGAWQVFLETPLLWAIAAAGSLCEERFILAPRFGQSYDDLRRRTALLLPRWAWALWVLLYLSVAWRVFSG